MPPLMLIHVAAGGLGLAAGFAALAVRKGERLHRAAGTAFFVAMLAMSGVGAFLALFLPNRPTAIIGALTFYLVATAWVAARRSEGEAGPFERGAFCAAVGLATLALGAGWAAAASPNGALDHIPAGVILGFAVLAGIAAAGDRRLIRQGGLSGAPRIRRHLWRMCAALAIAAMSFFLGQQDEFPRAIQGSPLLMVPPFVALVALAWWMARTRSRRAAGA